MKKSMILFLLILLTSCGNNINNNVVETNSKINLENTILKEDIKKDIISNKNKEQEIENYKNNFNLQIEKDSKLEDFISTRNRFLSLSDSEIKKIKCVDYKDLDLQNICNDFKNQNDIKIVDLSKKTLLDKKVFNKRFNVGDLSVCSDNYTNKDDIFDCKMGIVISFNKKCEIINEKDKCKKILNSIEFIKKYNNSMHDFNKYRNYINF